MSRICLTMVAVLVLSTAVIGVATAADEGQSIDTLSSYLHSHRLPLVEARMITAQNGERDLMLYGFVATEFGRRDAEEQARGYIDDPDVNIINRIKIRPELLTLGSTSTGAAAPAADDSQATSPDNAGQEASVQSQDFPDPIRDREAYMNQANDDELLTNNGLGGGGIPLAMAIVGSGFVFPPIGSPIMAPPVYYNTLPAPYYVHPPAAFTPPPIVVLRHSYTPPYTAPPMVLGGFPSRFSPSPFPAGPSPMFPATGGAPPFATMNPAFGGFHGNFGGFGMRGGFGGHR